MAVAAVISGLLLVSCEDSHQSRHALSDERAHLRNVHAVIYTGFIVQINIGLTEMLAQATSEKGASFLVCPQHGAAYVFQTNDFKWKNAKMFSDEVAMFCAQKHHGRFLVCRFDGSTTPSDTLPNLR